MPLRKPACYLKSRDFSSQEALEATRQDYLNKGFRVVVFLEKNQETDIHQGLKALIRHHWNQETTTPSSAEIPPTTIDSGRLSTSPRKNHFQ